MYFIVRKSIEDMVENVNPCLHKTIFQSESLEDTIDFGLKHKYRNWSIVVIGTHSFEMYSLYNFLDGIK